MRTVFSRRSAQADGNTGGDGGGDGGGGGCIAHTARHPRGRSRKVAQCRWAHLFLFGLALAGLMFFWIAVAQLKMSALDDKGWRWDAGRGASNRKKHVGAAVRFRPADLVRKIEEGQRRLDRLRSEERHGVRPPRLALVVGSMSKDSQSLMLLTLAKSLRELGYILSIFSLESGEAQPLWEHINSPVTVLNPDHSNLVDWTSYEGVMLSSLEAKRVISSLMQDPFTSITVLWLIQEGNLSKRLSSYIALGQQDLITEWRSAFCRANIVVFSDFSLPMAYTSLDTGNFYVVPGSPTDVWAAKRYFSSHSRDNLREKYGFLEVDLIVTIIGSHFFYENLPWGSAASLLTPQIMKITRIKELGGILKFVFLCGNSTDSFGSDFKELASRMGFPIGSIKHYVLDDDVNGIIMIADIVLYGSFQEEQIFPPLLMRAMSFTIPIIVPDLAVITKYVDDKKHGLVFRPGNIETLADAFLLLIEDNKLSTVAHSIAYNGRLLAENMLVSECISNFANILESMLQFPSDSLLPESISKIRPQAWAWDLLEFEDDESNGFQQLERLTDHPAMQRGSIIDILEHKIPDKSQIIPTDITGSVSLDYPTQLDWDELSEMEIAEDIERREMEEIAERMERDLGSWEDVYRNAKKSEKLRFEENERDEGELERIGQSLCIYEIYDGQGAWPFLHHGSLYRGISLSRSARRPRSDDVDAVSRLPILNESYYRDLLCEFGAMLSIANRVDSIHKVPWIGFQSWHASGSKVALSAKAEEMLENAVQQSKGDVIYYWVLVDLDWKDVEGKRNPDFWSICNIMNAGKCRSAFESAFRSMYGIPLQLPALPPMPTDGGQWSGLHSWVMPTSSYLEFIMFSRIFIDSLDSLNQDAYNSSKSCFLGSELEKRHCYCRILEVLVNVWAYHSARRMFYLDPYSGILEEQHPVEQRRMWVKYFDPELLKRMDEDLAEEADDNMHQTEGWLWPLTGEVHWQGILFREREDRYRKKMDKKRRNTEKLLDRHKYGYKQKSLANP